jgi:formamidopyrimidine-DNA glycosylase
MPELPEAETMRRHLQNLVIGQTISCVDVLREGSLQGQGIEEFRRSVEGRTIISVERRGKALILGLDEGVNMIFRLGMSGRLIYQREEAEKGAHARILFHLKEGGRLIFEDLRAFGRVRALPLNLTWEEANFKRMGIEPLGKELTPERLKQLLGKSRMQIKVALLDQSKVCGIGNIYASEILHRCRIHPSRSPGSLRAKEWEELASAIKAILKEAIEAGGSSISDYLKPDGSKGAFQNHLQVYGRGDKPCFRCGNKIVRIKQGGRSSFYCPNCQKEGKRTRDEE